MRDLLVEPTDPFGHGTKLLVACDHDAGILPSPARPPKRRSHVTVDTSKLSAMSKKTSTSFGSDFVVTKDPITITNIFIAKNLHLTHHASFWDAMILAACLDVGIRELYSEDLPTPSLGGSWILRDVSFYRVVVGAGATAGTIPRPSSIVRAWLAGTFVRWSFMPLGHSTSIADTTRSFARPKVSARSLCEQ